MRKEVERFSPLYCRYNGMMMGYFLAGALEKELEGRYPALRARVQEFLTEVGGGPTLPESYSEFTKGWAETWVEANAALEKRSREAAAFSTLGFLSMNHAIHVGVDDKAAEEYREAALPFMEQLGVPTAALSRFSNAVKRGEGGYYVNSLHSASLTFLREILDHIDEKRELHTVFVAMPFSDSYRRNFTRLYVPALEELGFRAFRAWGGLASESYYELLLTLIDKSGAVLAELSEPNLNVCYELGFADGRKKNVFALLEEGGPPAPSNFSGRFLVHYRRGTEGWEKEAITQIAGQIGLILISIERAAKSAHADAS